METHLHHSHTEHHMQSSDILRDIVIGMSDGLTVPFALAAGLSGAVQNTNLSIKVYDIIGNEVATIFEGNEAAGMSVHHVSVADMASGIYLVRISDGSSSITRRITVQ